MRRPLALSYLRTDVLADNDPTAVEIDIAGKRYAGYATRAAAFDSKKSLPAK